MAPLGHHIRIRLEDSRVIAHSADQQRVVARVVLAQGQACGLLAFGLPDTHLHLQARCDLRAAGRLSQRVGASLKQRLGLPVRFVTYPHEPIRDQRHLFNTLRYVLTQHVRHGLDPRAVLEATNLPDLIGLRLLGGYTRDHIARCLPRVQRATFLEWAGLTGLQSAEGPLDEVLAATLAATALPRLTGRSVPVLQARRALMEVVGPRLPTADLAALLGVTERTLYRFKHHPVDMALVRAIRLQLGLRRLD
ncbi:MAG: hypothetical protein ACK2U9_18030 [Anaerolineae bacterium]